MAKAPAFQFQEIVRVTVTLNSIAALAIIKAKVGNDLDYEKSVDDATGAESWICTFSKKETKAYIQSKEFAETLEALEAYIPVLEELISAEIRRKLPMNKKSGDGRGNVSALDKLRAMPDGKERAAKIFAGSNDPERWADEFRRLLGRKKLGAKVAMGIKDGLGL